jgi:hypothetical protein
MEKKKTIFKIRYYSVLCRFLLLVVLSFVFSRCQEESEEISPPLSEEVILANSSIAGYIRSIALSDGSSDNIVDHSSCTALVLPVRVVVNGQEIVITSADDFTTAEGILDEYEDDHDTLSVIFPVTVILTDHTHLVINSAEEFEDVAEECTEGGDDEDIECIDFEFPLSLSVYDSHNQVSRVITINNDEQLYAFFDTLEEGYFASFKFPVILIIAGGEEMTVRNNHQLEDIIEDHMDDCDEDDDNDHNDDDADDTGLIAALLAGEWKITRYFTGRDDTGLYEDFIITFRDDGSTLSSDGVSAITGDWETNGDDGTLILELELGGEAPFDRMPHSWNVLEFGSSFVQLKHINSEDASETTLVFERL